MKLITGYHPNSEPVKLLDTGDGGEKVCWNTKMMMICMRCIWCILCILFMMCWRFAQREKQKNKKQNWSRAADIKRKSFHQINILFLIYCVSFSKTHSSLHVCIQGSDYNICIGEALIILVIVIISNNINRIKQALLNRVTSCSCSESQRVALAGGTAGRVGGGSDGLRGNKG